MRKWLKRTLGSVSIVVGALVVVVAAIAVWNWSTIRIIRGTEGITGPQTDIPDPVAALGPASAGAHDWPAWRGARNDGKSTLTGIRKDWSGGLKMLWQVDYLCQSEAGRFLVGSQGSFL